MQCKEGTGHGFSTDVAAAGGVALVDRSEKRHADCVAVLEGWSGRTVTAEAILTRVALGEELGTDQVFTLDHRGFSAYRLNQRTAFRLFP